MYGDCYQSYYYVIDYSGTGINRGDDVQKYQDNYKGLNKSVVHVVSSF